MTRQTSKHPGTSARKPPAGPLRFGLSVLILGAAFYLLIVGPLGLLMGPVTMVLGAFNGAPQHAVRLFAAVAALIAGINVCRVILRRSAQGREGGRSGWRRLRARDIISLLPVAAGTGLGLIFLVMSAVKRITDGFWPDDLAFGAKLCPFAGLFIGLLMLSLISLLMPGERMTRRRALLLLLVLLYAISPKVSTTWLIESGLVREASRTGVESVYLHENRIVVDYRTECRVRDGLFTDKTRCWEVERWGSLPLDRRRLQRVHARHAR